MKDKSTLYKALYNCPQGWMKEAPHIKNVDMPVPIRTYNQYMGGVDLNDQLRSYYPSGHSGYKWWRYLFWFILDISIINALIFEHLSPHQPSPRRRRSLLQFKLDLAKQLIGGFCGRKRYPGHKRKCTPMAMALPNLLGHQEVKFAGRKRACFNCSANGSKTSSYTQTRTHMLTHTQVITKIQPYIDNEDFTPAAISKVSKACTSICQWVRAMHKYHYVAKSVAPKRVRTYI